MINIIIKIIYLISEKRVLVLIEKKLQKMKLAASERLDCRRVRGIRDYSLSKTTRCSSRRCEDKIRSAQRWLYRKDKSMVRSVGYTAAILHRVAEQLRSKGPRWLAGAHAFAKRGGGTTDGDVDGGAGGGRGGGRPRSG